MSCKEGQRRALAVLLQPVQGGSGHQKTGRRVGLISMTLLITQAAFDMQPAICHSRCWSDASITACMPLLPQCPHQAPMVSQKSLWALEAVVH